MSAPVHQTIAYLRLHRGMLETDDRIFFDLMARREKEKLPLHTEHEKRLEELASAIQNDLAW